MNNLLAFAVIMAVPGLFILLVLRHAWRSRGTATDGDSGNGWLGDSDAGSDGGGDGGGD